MLLPALLSPVLVSRDGWCEVDVVHVYKDSSMSQIQILDRKTLVDLEEKNGALKEFLLQERLALDPRRSWSRVRAGLPVAALEASGLARRALITQEKNQNKTEGRGAGRVCRGRPRGAGSVGGRWCFGGLCICAFLAACAPVQIFSPVFLARTMEGVMVRCWPCRVQELGKVNITH